MGNIEEFVKKLSEYQRIQSIHDNDYHSDIVDPGSVYRLKHIALHFAKYASKLMNEDSAAAYSKAFIDTFIMAISASVVLEIDFKKVKLDIDSSDNIFFYKFINNMSLFAKACESVDHKEVFPVYENQVNSILNLINACYFESKRKKIDVLRDAKSRLKDVEKIIDKKRNNI